MSRPTIAKITSLSPRWLPLLILCTAVVLALGWGCKNKDKDKNDDDNGGTNNPPAATLSPTPTPVATADNAPTIRLNPLHAAFSIGEEKVVKIDINTYNGQAIRGGAIIIRYLPEIFEIVGGAAGVTKVAESPFNLGPPPVLATGRLEIAFAEPSFNNVPYTGSIAQFTVKALAHSTTNSLLLDTSTNLTRFSPDLTGTVVPIGNFIVPVPVTVTPTETPVDTATTAPTTADTATSTPTAVDTTTLIPTGTGFPTPAATEQSSAAPPANAPQVAVVMPANQAAANATPQTPANMPADAPADGTTDVPADSAEPTAEATPELTATEEPTPGNAPTISLVPNSGTTSVGSDVSIQIILNTSGGAARGGAVIVLFDQSVFDLIGGVQGIVPLPGGPFTLSPPARVRPGRIEIPFLNPGFQPIAFTGPLAQLTFKALTPSAGTALGFDPTLTRFSPDLEGTLLGGAAFAVIDSGSGNPNP